VKISSFTFIVTDACNWQCTYCYQKKGGAFLDRGTVEEACEFFFPFFTAECSIHFYGGEPLLAWPLIRGAVKAIEHLNEKEGKSLLFSIATNGSLLTAEVLKFLANHRFQVQLSHDGFAQEEGRKRGSGQTITRRLDSLLKSEGIALLTNSVFTPSTVGHLARSLKYLSEAGVSEVQFSPSIHQSWRGKDLQAYRLEIAKLRAFLVKYYRRTGTIPVRDFRRPMKSGLVSCSAGLNRLALAPDGRIWGCYLLADCFKGKEESREGRDFCFGRFQEFSRNPRRASARALAAHRRLRAENFFTPKKLCALCDRLEECSVCPAGPAIFSGLPGLVPSDLCRLNRIFYAERRLFWKEAGLQA
jgi:uncharacterized protein